MPVIVPDGGTYALKIGFTPVSTTSYFAQLTLIDASGYPIAHVPMQRQGSSQGAPLLTTSAASLSFGSVTVNTSTTQAMTLTSTGTSPVTVKSVKIAGAGFTTIGGSLPVTLNPMRAVMLQLQFEPTTVGAITGLLTISSNSTSGSTEVVALSGTGTAIAHEVDLSWNAPTSSPDPVAGYNIYRSTGSGSLVLMNSSPDSSAVYVDSTDVSGATTYSYVVRSVDANGVESIASNQITLTIP